MAKAASMTETMIIMVDVKKARMGMWAPVDCAMKTVSVTEAFASMVFVLDRANMVAPAATRVIRSWLPMVFAARRVARIKKAFVTTDGAANILPPIGMLASRACPAAAHAMGQPETQMRGIRCSPWLSLGRLPYFGAGNLALSERLKAFVFTYFFS